MKSENENYSSSIVARVSIKPPTFWKPDPKIWFLQLEAQFRNASITAGQTKYDYVVSSIKAEILAQVTDILTNEDCKYTTIIYIKKDSFPSSLKLKLKRLRSY
ncbi:hypothetical protein TNCT_535591 [Trichonephila clavata]|uniref:DUF7041 domain-containing protein n=1 Tax=Trichonephila clavata TaxID=2740835 RepID=A0A8X6FS77_TRICU|nr:hypothetical protein TNCT_535591 [Trichonephila clavata]